MSRRRPELPVLLVLAEPASAADIADLFARRGFAATAVSSAEQLARSVARGGAAPAVAILDFRHQDAHRALRALSVEQPRPVVVGVVEEREVATTQEHLDAAFTRPVDPARLFARVVELLARRKKGSIRGRRKLTGIVGVVDGNDLFVRIAGALSAIVPPVNAGAILEQALRELGVGTFVVKQADLAAVLASGRLAAALVPFAPPAHIEAALVRIERLVAGDV